MDALNRGRDAFSQQAWGAAYEHLSAADREDSLAPVDLERLATAAYLVGEEADSVAAWTRAYHALLDGGEVERAARCGFWLAHNLLLAGEVAQSRGWLARTQRLLDQRQPQCVERGYLLVVAGLYAIGDSDVAASYDLNCRAAEIAERYGDADLVTIGLLCRGKALIELGETADAMRLLDEAVVAVAAGEVSPIVTGIVYCAAILTCRKVFDLARAREWTAALNGWCAAQPDLVPFRGQCLVHRSEIMQLQGDWKEAVTEAQRACDWLSMPRQPALPLAFYQLAELHRLRGEFAKAEDAYRQASRSGLEPQPGLSLLRLAQGRGDDAKAAIRRMVDEAEDVLARAQLLGPLVEIMLATDEVETAGVGADDLAEIAAEVDVPVLHAASAQATGMVLRAEGDTSAGLAALRQAWALWQDLDTPYEVARIRVHLARTCRELGDHDTAELHLDAARAVFARLGAAPDLARVRALSRRPAAESAGGLTRREREVLTLVAAGRTNRQIAEVLVISEKTVERHLSNMFTKLGISSRSAATAYAYEHDLV